MDSLLDFIRRAIRLALMLVVVAIVLNDGIRLASALSRGAGGLKDATNAALDIAAATPNERDAAETAAAMAATARGTTLVAYGHNVAGSGATLQISVTVAVDTRVVRTIVVAPIVGLVRRIPSAEWYSDAGVPITLRQSKKVNYFTGS